MKELKVHQTSDLVTFSYYAQENLERSDAGALVGSVGSNGELAYLAHGAALEVVKIADGSRRSACNLGAIRENIVIRCIAEFVVGYSRKLLLGLEVAERTRRGLLCVYDLSMSKVIRAIWMPEAVTVITVIEDITEIDSDLATLSNEHSKNLIVVGCKGGQVLAIKIGEMTPYDHENDLSFPAELQWITIKSLLKLGGSKVQSSTNYCLDLSAASYSDGTFKYLDPTGKPLKVFRRDQVAVSSLLFMRQTSLLVAGYSFGCFNIWDLQNLQPIFSSSYSPALGDITHLVFQEPENDPRYCCYLMVGRSPSGLLDSNIPTTMTLYQLVFEIKETSNTGYYTYRDLEAVCKRFDHQLTSDSNHLADLVSIGSRIISCSALPRKTKQQRLDQSVGGSIEAEGKLFDTTLSYIVWESPPHEPEETHSSYHLGLFDINRWYQLQMPCSVGYAMYGSSDPVCPFFAFYSLSEVSEAILPDSLVDCFINAKEIISFSSTNYPTLEQNFWPSALAFNCTCLAERGIVRTEMLGMQRQILADLVSRGSEVFNHGYQLINLCWSAGLIPKLEVSRLDDPQIQFECLMSVAIEHSLIGFILCCIKDWSRGEITNAGNCLRSVLHWTWRRVIKAKGILDEHYIKLFYAETSKMDGEVIRSLSNCAYELKWLSQILSALKESPVSITDEGISSLSTKLTVTNCIHRYADAILFFLRSGILPESTESKQVNLQSPFDDRLFIDEYCKVIEDKIRENGNDDDFGWDGQYPPPSVNVVCKSLLLDISRDDLINFLYYWILDAAKYLEMDKLAESAYYFFKISKTQKNVIEGLWNIDHNYLESGVEKLMEFGPELLSEAMRTVYRVGNKSLACQIYKAKEMLLPGDIDWKFCIKILAENMALYEAYKLQAKYRESDIAFEVYQHFLEECARNNLLPKLFDFYLTEEDEDWLYQFLDNKGNQICKELLVVFCIKRHRYAEAMKHGACFDHQRWTYSDKSLFGGVPSRRAVMHMTNEIILPLQRRLISFPKMKSDVIARNDQSPSPLSSAIARKSSRDDISQSGSIFKILRSVGANRSNPEMATLDEPYNLPFVRSAKTAITRKRREYSTQPIKTEESFVRLEKKSILKPAISEATKCEIPTKRRKHLFYGSEAMKLLQTPPVIKNPKHLKMARNFPTPASILKSSKTGTNKDGTAKSVRKRVVISDPSFSVSPMQLSESPSKLPESPSCLTPEVFKLDETVEHENTARESENASVSDHPGEEVAKSLDFGENDELKSSVSEKDSEFSLQLDTTDDEPVASPDGMDHSICLELEADSGSATELEAENGRKEGDDDIAVMHGVKDSGMDVENEMEQVAERKDEVDEKSGKTDDKVVTIRDDSNSEGEEDIVDEEQLNDQKSFKEELNETEDRVESEEKIDNCKKGNSEDVKNDGTEEQFQIQLNIENKQKNEAGKLLEDRTILEPWVRVQSEAKSEIEEKLEIPEEVEDFTSIKSEVKMVTERSGDHLHEEHEEASSRVESGLSDKENLQMKAGEIEIIVPMESKAPRNESIQPILGLDLGLRLTSSYNLNTPSSDVGTPDAHVSSIDSSNLSPLSSSVIGTPDEGSTSPATFSSGRTQWTHRMPGDGGALQEVADKIRGDLKVVVGKTEVTREMRNLDSSFESHGEQDNSVISTASGNYSSPLVFDASTQDLDTTSPKEAKMSERTSIVTRRKAKGKQADGRLPSPVKTQKSHSPVKSKRRAFYTPKKSPVETSSGTARVTRSSARKNASGEAIREIEKTALLSSSISESPISFAPVSKSEQQKMSNRSKRNSLQSPLVNTHSMTLRSRSRPTSFALK